MVFQERPSAPVHVVGIVWDRVAEDLNKEEKEGRCKLQDIQAMLTSMAKQFPERVKVVSL